MSKAPARSAEAAAPGPTRLDGRREQTRQRLVRAGCRLFAERGLEEVSVEEILSAADVSRRTFYAYFANKYELVASAINSALLEAEARLTASEGEPDDRLLDAVIHCYRQLWRSHGDALSVIASLPPGIRPYVGDRHKRFGEVLKGLLLRAEGAGLLLNDDAQLSFKIISRTAIPLLKIYSTHPKGESLYRRSMLRLLAKES